jgi:hypothetical protein
MKKFLVAVAGLSLLVLPFGAVSAEDLTISGHIDVGFTHSFNNPTNNMGNTLPLALQDLGNTMDDQFAAKLAQIEVSKKAEPVGFEMKLDFFDTARGLEGDDADDIEVQTANIIYVIESVGAGLTMSVGKMESLIGRDVIESADNWFISQGLLYQIHPKVLLGVRASYPVLENLTATVGVNNGANLEVDNNTGKSVEAQLTYSPTEALTISGQINYGAEGAADADTKTTIINIVGTYDVTEELSVYAEFTWAHEQNAVVTKSDLEDAIDAGVDPTTDTQYQSGADTWGIGVGARYKITDQYGVSARFEYVSYERNDEQEDDETFDEFVDSYDETANVWQITLTGHMWLTENLELRVEFRHDDAEDDLFADDSDDLTDDADNKIGAMLLYTF